MDSQTQAEFKKVHETLGEVKDTVLEYISYQKGLHLEKRMLSAEEDIKSKASWNALYLSVGLIIMLAGLVVSIIK